MWWMVLCISYMHIGRAPGRCEAEASGRLAWEKGQVTHCCCKGYEQVWEAEIQGWQVLLFVWWIVGHNLQVLSWLSLRKYFDFVTQPLNIFGQWPSCKIWSILAGSFSQVYTFVEAEKFQNWSYLKGLLAMESQVSASQILRDHSHASGMLYNNR